MQEEESAKRMYSLQLETFAKDNDVALSKIRCSKGSHQLTKQLAADKGARRHELGSTLDRLGAAVASSKLHWEESWMEASGKRVEETHKQKMEDLLQWRKREVDDLIRRSILDQDEKIKSSADEYSGLHQEKVAELSECISTQRDAKKELDARISRIGNRRAKQQCSIGELEEDLRVIDNKVRDAANTVAREKKQKKQAMTEASHHIEGCIQSITGRRDDIEREIESLKEKHSKALE